MPRFFTLALSILVIAFTTTPASACGRCKQLASASRDGVPQGAGCSTGNCSASPAGGLPAQSIDVTASSRVIDPTKPTIRIGTLCAKPVAGPIGPQGPKGDQGDPGHVTEEQVKSILVQLQKFVADNPGTFRGNDGAPGDTGTPADETKIVNAVLANLKTDPSIIAIHDRITQLEAKKLTVQVYDEQLDLRQSYVVRLGDKDPTLKLQLVPKTPATLIVERLALSD